MQRVQNAAARLVLGLGPRDQIVDGLRQLHWQVHSPNHASDLIQESAFWLPD